MTTATQKQMWRRGEQVLETRSSFAYLRPGCGHSQASVSANPVSVLNLIDTGPPGT